MKRCLFEVRSWTNLHDITYCNMVRVFLSTKHLHPQILASSSQDSLDWDMDVFFQDTFCMSSFLRTSISIIWYCSYGWLKYNVFGDFKLPQTTLYDVTVGMQYSSFFKFLGNLLVKFPGYWLVLHILGAFITIKVTSRLFNDKSWLVCLWFQAVTFLNFLKRLL